MGKLPRLTDQNLLNTVRKLPPEIFRNDSKRSFHLALGIIKYFLGYEFLEKHVSPEVQTPGYLRLLAADGLNILEERGFRLVDLAEALYNLQNVEGVDECIDRMRRGTVEPTYAELDFGRFLFIASLPFRFVERQFKKGCDYDVEITLDRWVVCADAKCKIEATEFSEETVLNTLRGAINQFPKDQPSFIFVKVPARWMEAENMRSELTRIADRFLQRDTERVVSVKFYASDLRYRDGHMEHHHMFGEITNPRNRFDTSRNWNIFDKLKGVSQSGWNRMPAHWRRILYFPRDMIEADDHDSD